MLYDANTMSYLYVYMHLFSYSDRQKLSMLGTVEGLVVQIIKKLLINSPKLFLYEEDFL